LESKPSDLDEIGQGKTALPNQRRNLSLT